MFWGDFMQENKAYRMMIKCQLGSILLLGLFFCFFEKKVGIKNYMFYKINFQYTDYLNENIILLLTIMFLLFAGISLLYSSVSKLERSVAIETLLLSTIFLVWALMYKNRTYYYYGIVVGMVLNVIQNLKLLIYKYSKENSYY